MSGLIVPPWHADDVPPRPSGFLFGGATFAAHVEGPGEAPARGADASDAWRTSGSSARFLENHGSDWRLAKELGLGAVAFSLSWARLVPDGRGRVRPEALDAYVRVAEAAARLGLRAFATLWHDDLPAALGTAGWGADAALPERFADVAEQAGLRLGSLVSFVTLHEPGALVLPGPRAPAQGERDLRESARNAARAHALAMQALRATCAAPVGLALDLVTAIPLGRDAGDLPAARFVEACRTLCWLHLAAGRRGVLTRALPEHGALSPSRAQLLGAVDAAEAAPCDFVILRPSPAVRAAHRAPAAFGLQVEASGAPGVEAWVQLVTAWKELAPDGAGPEPLAASRHEGRAGAPDEEPDPETGRVEDLGRAQALERDLAGWRQALQAGVPLRGWFTGLLDGFELDRGFSVRAGIIHVDAADGRRRTKASGERLRGLIEEWG